MKASSISKKQNPKRQNKNYFSQKNLDSNQLIKNFVNALNLNFCLSIKQISESSTTISDKELIEYNHSKNHQQIQQKCTTKKRLLAQFQCLQKIQNQKNQLRCFSMQHLTKEIQKTNINPIYFVKHQGIKTESRTILMDWITQLSSQFAFKRETSQLAKILVDVYLSTTSRIPLRLLQLVGVSCLLISSKIQESIPKSLVQMAYATACLYNVTQIKLFQMQILTKLKYRVRYLTYDSLINIIVKEWAHFFQTKIDSYEFILSDEQSDPDSLKQMFQSMLDIITLDSESLNYNFLQLCLSLLIILVGYTSGWLSKTQIQHSLIYNSRYLLGNCSYFLIKIQQFLLYFQYCMSDLLSCIQFVSSYFFVIEIDQPLSNIQTYNNFSLQYIKLRKQLVKSIQMIFQ